MSTITGVVADTKFSHKRGFYTGAFSLSITCASPGVTIRYTTNGTAPTATTGLIFATPILINKTELHAANARFEKTSPLLIGSDADANLSLSDRAVSAPVPAW